MNVDGKNWLSYDEVANILNCEVTYVSYLKKTNKLHFEKIEKKFRCTEQELKRYLSTVKFKGKKSPFENIMLDWDESCKFLYSYFPQSPYYPYFAPSLKYLVSDKGRIFSIDYARELTRQKDTNGYYQVTISGKNQQAVQCMVNRLVAGVWCQNYLNKPHVHHINGKKTDNNSKNLIWVTEREHGELHRLLRNGQKAEYKSLIKKIRADNAYPKKWQNGISIIDPGNAETENYVYYLHLTKRGYDEFKKEGTVNPSEILREVAFFKN